jgi:hypothetical protein
MRIAVMQPTYLPWLGYFDLMDSVDHFVFLDHVQFVKQSWHQRNRIKYRDAALWLSVPVQTSGKLGQMLSDTKVLENGWRRKHLASLHHAYSKAPFWLPVNAMVTACLSADTKNLADLNMTLIRATAQYLGIGTNFVRSSNLRTSGRKEEMLTAVCLELGASSYLSPLGAAEYLGAGAELQSHGVEVLYQHYDHPVYPQMGETFLSFLSCIDLLCTTDPQTALAVIRSGRRVPYSFDSLPLAPTAPVEARSAHMNGTPVCAE